MDRPLLIGKKYENKLVSHVKAHQRWPSAEEDSNDLFCGYQSSSFPSQSCQRAIVAEGRLCMGSVSWTSTHQGQPGYSQCIWPIYQQQRQTLRHHSLGLSASYQVAGWLQRTTSIMKWASFSSYWNRHLLWIWFCHSYMQCCCQNYSPWTYTMCYAPWQYDTQHCFMVKLCVIMDTCSWILCYHSEVVDLIEWCFKDVVTVLARWQYFAGLG